MTGEELIEFRARLGWGRAELARRLGIGPSRLADNGLGLSIAAAAAVMLVHGIGRILIFNVADFAGYGVSVPHPSAVS
jgi:transcriptional regulator with XRE-family HTH domain